MKFYFCLSRINCREYLGVQKFLTLHSALYASNSAELLSCIELMLEKLQVAAVEGTRFSPPALLVLWRGGGRELCVTAMFLINQ